MKTYYVYILANKTRGLLYTGMTGNLIKRIYLHKQGASYGFAKKYGIHKLVHYEEFSHPLQAIEREKRIKKWYRHWKIELIEQRNPSWKDLFNQITFT